MNPFIYLAAFVCVSPLLGYAYAKAFKGSFIKVNLIAIFGCASLYTMFFLSGIRFIGEEGDYTLFAILFLLFNLLFFQLLRLKPNKFAYSMFVFFFSVSAIVVGLQALITVSYIFTELSKNS